jgi:basic membrane protein A and related proteins
VNRVTRAAVVATATALTLAACAAAPEEEPPADTPEPGATETTDEEPVDFSACMVSDQGGFEDRSFNQSGAEGLERAEAELGIDITLVESAADTDYTPNIQSLVAQECDLIIGVGFLLEDPIQSAAEANAETNFALVDSAFTTADFAPVELENGKPLLFNTQEAAFLAGYVAAGASQTGVVATFGGIQIPSVSIFMDGFADGVALFNEENGADVQVLGWDKAAQTGTFTGDFENQANGQNVANGFIDQGADVIMPVAGPVGLGAAAAAQEAGDVWIIGVDADWYETSPDYAPIILTSVVKLIGSAVYDTVEGAVNGEFDPTPYVGTLENGGVDIAPYHDAESAVPAEVATRVEELREEIASGERTVESPSANTTE